MRIAVIGCGMIGELRARAIARMTNAELRLVCDVDAERAQSLATRCRCLTETEWRSAASRNDVDIVVVSTPNDTHADIALHAMESGKHVLCEKPLGRTPDECRSMVTCAAQHGVKLMTGFNHRQYPPILKAKQLLEDGAIGKPLSLRGWIGHEAGPDFLKRWVGNAGVSGGGTLVDNGVHLIDLVRFLVGEITEAQGYARTSLWDIRPSEDQALALLQTENGAIAFIMSSWTEWRGYHFSLQITGSHGTLTAQYPPMLTLLDTKGTGGGRARRRRFLFLRDQIAERIRSYRWTVERSFSRELEELIAAIKEDRAPAPDGYDGLRATEVAYAVYESSRRGCRIALPPGGQP